MNAGEEFKLLLWRDCTEHASCRLQQRLPRFLHQVDARWCINRRNTAHPSIQLKSFSFVSCVLQCEDCAAGHSAKVVEINDNLKSRSNEDKKIGTRIKQPIIILEKMMRNDDERVGVLCVKSSACVFGWREEYLIHDLTSRR